MKNLRNLIVLVLCILGNAAFSQNIFIADKGQDSLDVKKQTCWFLFTAGAKSCNELQNAYNVENNQVGGWDGSKLRDLMHTKKSLCASRVPCATPYTETIEVYRSHCGGKLNAVLNTGAAIVGKNGMFITDFAYTVSCPSAEREPSSNPNELRLALNWKPEPQFGGFYSAQFDGAFKNEKLNVKILEGGSGTPTVQMVAAGSAEYGIVSADELIIAHARGSTDLVALFAVYQTNPQGIMTHEERKYSSIGDVLKDGGATLLWQSGLPYAQFILKKQGKGKAKQAPYAGGIGPFLADKKIAQQCFVTSEPIAAKKAGASVKTFLVADTGYNPYTTVLVTQRSRLEKNRDEVTRVVKAVRAGWTSYLKDSKSINEQMHRLNPSMDAETFAASAEAQLPLIQTAEAKEKGLGVMTSERWETLATQLFELKVIPKKPDTKDMFIML